MIVAIYARKSTEQYGVGGEEKSVTRQIEHARAYATKKSWIVADEHVYVDDGISGAEFVKRPGFLRLMNALKPRPPFGVLIMSEESRLGREQIETAYALKQITDAGVRIFFYLEDRERTLDTAMDKVMLSLTNFAAEMEREKARQRTYDAMARKARALQVTGGKVYGYDNVEVASPGGKRLHVLRRINREQASVVRRIFEMYASGPGLTRIAKALNAEGIRSPRGDGWAPSAIREMLYRPLYRGEIVWNRSQKVVRGGTKKQRKRPSEQWVKLPAPDLQVIDDDLWQAVHARLEHNMTLLARGRGGALLSQPARVDGDSPYLLTGFTRCALCSGAIGGVTQYHGSGPVAARRRVTHYECTRRRKRGNCDNDVVVPTDVVDHVLLEAIREVLDERIVEVAIDKALARLRSGQERQLDRRTQIERELSLIEAKLVRLVEALANGGPMETLLAQMKAEEGRKKTLTVELAELADAARLASLDGARIKRNLKARVADVRGVLGRHTTQSRQMLRKLLPDKIRVEPVQRDGRRGFRLAGEVSLGRLIRAEVLREDGENNSPTVVAPTGFEPVFQP